MLHGAGDAMQLPDELFELFRTAKVQVAVPQKADGQHHENRQADGQCGENDVEEQRVEGCERLGQWRLQMQASGGRIQQRGGDDKRIDLGASGETFTVVLRLARSNLPPPPSVYRGLISSRGPMLSDAWADKGQHCLHWEAASA